MLELSWIPQKIIQSFFWERLVTWPMKASKEQKLGSDQSQLEAYRKVKKAQGDEIKFIMGLWALPKPR